MSHEQSDVEEIKRRRKQMKRAGWRKWLRRLFVTAASLLVLGTLAATIAWYVVRNQGIARRDAIIAELDATDANWRTTDLTSARNASLPPDDQNAAAQALTAAKRIPKSFDEWVKKENWRTELKLPHLPHPEQVEEARGVLAECGDAVRQARSLPKYSSGGFPLTFNEPNPLDTLLPNTQEMRRVASLLELNALLAAHDGKGNDSLDSGLAALAVARGVCDEPGTIPMLVRMAVTSIAVKMTERTLAWTTADDGTLARVQLALAAEADVPRLKYAIRGDRAAMYRMMENLDAGRLTVSQIAITPGGPTMLERAGTILLRATLPEQQARLLELMNQGVAAADRPSHERAEVFGDIEVWVKQAMARDRYQYLMVVLLLPAYSKMNEAETRVIAQVRCASVSLACKRYRLKSGAFPAKLADLPKNLLSDVPADPYTGKPLVYKLTDEGAVVYVCGADRTDDGGNLKPGSEPGFDIGFQLFTPEHRRKPPLPKPDPDQPEHP